MGSDITRLDLIRERSRSIKSDQMNEYENIKTLLRKVERVLKLNPKAKTHDAILIGLVYQKCYGVHSSCSLQDLIEKIATDKLPSFESISRAKRTILNRDK